MGRAGFKFVVCNRPDFASSAQNAMAEEDGERKEKLERGCQHNTAMSLTDLHRQHVIPVSQKLFKNKTLLYYARDMEDLAREVSSLSAPEFGVVLGDVRWNRFKDGFPNLYMEHAECIRWSNVAFLASVHSPDVFFEQIALMFSLPRYLAKNFKVILPYFSTGTMERIQDYGEVATAKTLARVLSAIPLSSGGPAEITIFDIHTLQNQFYFSDNVLVRLRTCLGLLKRRLKALEDYENVTICFPDEGAQKRFQKYFQTFKLITCHKVRRGADRVVQIKDGFAAGRHVVVVDDLVQSGGTLIQCAKALKTAGACKVSCYVTHGVFPQQSWKRFVNNDLFSFFWCVNTHPAVKQVIGKSPFEILSCAPILKKLLLNEPSEEEI